MTTRGGARGSDPYSAALCELARDALIALSREGTVLQWNEGARALFGYEAAEATGRCLVDWAVTNEQADGLRAALAEASSRGSACGVSMVRCADGSARAVEVALRDVPASERRPGFIAARARELPPPRLSSEIVANMSHELRTPLSAITGFAELMLREKVGPISDRHKEYLGDILESARQLLRLMNDVIDLAKLDSRRVVLRPEVVDVPVAVAEVVDVLSPHAAEKRISVETNVDEDVSVVVLDRAMLKRVIHSYLSNALKFGPADGRVAIRARPAGHAEIRIEVEDGGAGLPPDAQHRVFVEFEQLDTDGDRRHPSGGLGLAITKRIVEAQGGRVGIESVANATTTFWATLPRDVRAKTAR